MSVTHSTHCDLSPSAFSSCENHLFNFPLPSLAKSQTTFEVAHSSVSSKAGMNLSDTLLYSTNHLFIVLIVDKIIITAVKKLRCIIPVHSIPILPVRNR